MLVKQQKGKYPQSNPINGFEITLHPCYYKQNGGKNVQQQRQQKGLFPA
jgi:hypothetical protein